MPPVSRESYEQINKQRRPQKTNDLKLTNNE